MTNTSTIGELPFVLQELLDFSSILNTKVQPIFSGSDSKSDRDIPKDSSLDRSISRLSVCGPLSQLRLVRSLHTICIECFLSKLSDTLSSEQIAQWLGTHSLRRGSAALLNKLSPEQIVHWLGTHSLWRGSCTPSDELSPDDGVEQIGQGIGTHSLRRDSVTFSDKLSPGKQLSGSERILFGETPLCFQTSSAQSK
jgi:hypothetical protein